MTAIRALLRRGPRSWGRLVTLTALAAVIEVQLRLGRLPSLAKRLGVRMDEPPDRKASLQLTVRERRLLADARTVVHRGPFDGSCLRQALMTGYVLRAHRPHLLLGVAKDAGTVRAHAWIVADGQHIDDFRFCVPDASGLAVLPVDADLVAR